MTVSSDLEPAAQPVTDQFISLEPDACLRLQPFGAILERRRNDGRSDRWNLNEACLDAIRQCNGRNTVGKVITTASRRGSTGGDAQAMARVLFDLLQAGVLTLHEDPHKLKPKEFGDPSVLTPSHLMLELTDHCNLACRHCYRNSSPACRTFLETDRVLEILDQAWQLGVVSVELTGGEATSHPGFLEIAAFAANRFDIVSILTNGTLMSDDMVGGLAPHAANIIVQVDLDGATARQHERLRGLRGSFELAQNTIQRLSEAGLRVRAAMNVYPDNVDFIEVTFGLAMALGARWFGASPVMELGRAKSKLALNGEQFHRLGVALERLRQAHPSAIQGTDELAEIAAAPNSNCGAGWRSLAIGPDGTIRPCAVFDPDALSLGNINLEDLAPALKRADLVYFQKLQPPGPETCTGCPMERFCRGCFARTLEAWRRAAQQGVQFECNWAKTVGFKDRLARSAPATEAALH